MSSGFQFIEQPLFIKNCGPATTIPMIIYADSGTYEGCSLAITYVTSSSIIIAQKRISLDDYEYSDISVQKIKGFFENNMWTGASGNILLVRLFDHRGLVKKDSITVVEEEWTLRESLEHAYNELHTFLEDRVEQDLVPLSLPAVSGFGTLIDKTDEYMAYKIITNPDQYSGHPSKNLTLMSGPLLRNTGVSQPLLHREFTKKTNYRLDFMFQTSVNNRTGFSYGFEPDLASGSDPRISSSGPYGLNILTDIGNTYIETFDNGSRIQLYTDPSNLFSAGNAHRVNILRNGMTADIYIDKQLIYRYDNIKYNTIGLNKWGSGYNQISDIQLSIDPE